MIYLHYLWSLLQHKWSVLKASRWTGVPLWRAIIHDWSKFLPVEFINYARWHFGAQSLDGWAKAWGHHQNHNPHHPEYWLLSWRGDPDSYHGLGQHVADFVTVLPMPEIYVREMIADFFGASKIYTGSWNIDNWLNENGPKMILHDETKRLIATVMFELAYMLTDNCDWSWLRPFAPNTKGCCHE